MNFKRSEFACNCGCGQDTVDYELMVVLQVLRNHFKAPVTINSGNRCEEYNRYIGGVPNSMHLVSKAADITVKGVTPKTVYKYLYRKYRDKYGIGNYTAFTHIDVREKKARF